MGRAGWLYGSTASGGEFGTGTAFRLNADDSGFQILHSFDNNTGGPELPQGRSLDGSDFQVL